MKNALIVIILSSVFATGSANAAGNEIPQEKEVVVSLSDAYVPGGFDSNSDSYVIANGLFPNGCYRWKRSEVNTSGNIHEIKSVASVSQGMCIMVLVPFTKEIRLGKLEAGNHTVRFVNGDGTYMEKQLVIEE